MLYRLQIIFVFATGVALRLPIVALDPSTPLTEYFHQSWERPDGLPGMVSAIVQSTDGYLWLGTQHGVVRFDGTRFTIFNPENTPGLKGAWVEALLADQKAGVWVATYDGGVSRLGNGSVETFTKQNGLSSNQARSLYQDHEGAIWVGTDDGSLSEIWRGKIASVLRPHLNGMGAIIRSMLEDEQHRLWLTAPGSSGTQTNGPIRGPAAVTGLFSLERGRLTPHEILDGPRSIEAVSLMRKQNAEILVGSRMGLGSYQSQTGTYERLWPKKLSHDNIVRSIANDQDGTVWFATSTGLKRLRNGKVDSFGAEEGLTADVVYALLPDKDGNLWIGTSGGLDRLADRTITSYTRKQGLLADQVWSVVEDLDGAIWVGTNGGLNKILAGRITSYTTKEGLPSNSVYSVQAAPDGSIWFTTESGLCVLNHNGIRVFGAKDGLPISRVVALLWRRDGSLVVSLSRGGLFLLKNGTFVPYLPLPELVWSISEAHDGSLWLSTFGQLLHWKDNHLTAFGEQSDMYLYSYEDKYGTVWAGSMYAGLVCLRKNALVHFAPLGAPFNDRIYRIFEDHSGNLWITTPNGLYRVRKSDLISHLEGKVRSVFAAEFGMADGLPSTGCNGGEQNAGWTDRSGRFWIPTGRGLAMVDPQRIMIETRPARTIIEQVTLDDKPIQHGIAPHFPPDHKRIEIRYTGIDLRAPNGVRYRYRLEGFDTDWVNAGTTKAVSYTTLHPGTYHFCVISRNRDGLWDLTGASFSFEVEPQFYRTVWFSCLCSALAILIAGTLHLWRVQQIREKTSIALAERTRMARQIHDTLLQGVSGASLVLQAIAPAITNTDVRRRLDNALNEMQQCMTDTRRALWDIHDPQPERGDFIALLERYGRGLTMGTQTRFVVEAAETLQNCPSGVQHHLLRIGQEAILNALKHSGASEIRVSLSVNDNTLHMRVSDNGRGFNVNALEQSEGHWGLMGMREHARAIGQDLAVSAAPGMGTEIVVTADLTNETRS